MANHAHSTRTPLLPLAGALPPLLPRGAAKQVGPVTAALAAMHAADPDRQRIRALRKAIGDRIEADIALLDRLAGDADLEDGADHEPSLGAPNCMFGLGTLWGAVTDGSDREAENEHGGDVQDEPHDQEPDERVTAFEWAGIGEHVFTSGGHCL